MRRKTNTPIRNSSLYMTKFTNMCKTGCVLNKDILKYKDPITGQTFLHKAALKSKEISEPNKNVVGYLNTPLRTYMQDPEKVIKEVGNTRPDLVILFLLTLAEPSLPDIGDNSGVLPGKEKYSGRRETSIFIKRLQQTHTWRTDLLRLLGLRGGTKTKRSSRSTRRNRQHRASYRGSRAARS